VNQLKTGKSQIKCTPPGWTDRVNGPIVHVGSGQSGLDAWTTGDSNRLNGNVLGGRWIVTINVTGRINLWTETGRRMMSTLISPCPISFMDCCQDYLMVLGCTGDVMVWNISTLKRTLAPISIFPLLQSFPSASPLSSSSTSSSSLTSSTAHQPHSTSTSSTSSGAVPVSLQPSSSITGTGGGGHGDSSGISITVKSIRVLNNGLPIIVLTNQHQYSYHEGMGGWVDIGESGILPGGTNEKSRIGGWGIGKYPRTTDIGWLEVSVILVVFLCCFFRSVYTTYLVIYLFFLFFPLFSLFSLSFGWNSRIYLLMGY